jgi:putative aminopeptidase FrvX
MSRKILQEMLSIPTAPFAEHLMIEFVESFCADLPGVKLTYDEFGNILVHVRRGNARVKRPPCITAHLDHPGFVAQGRTAKGLVKARWRGGVPNEYFDGAKVRFWVDDRWVRGRIAKVKLERQFGTMRVGPVEIEAAKEVPAGSIGMWDLPEPAIRGSRIHARCCDDIAGAAAMLSCIKQMSKSKKTGEAYFLFTRAEEVGFVGAIAACEARTIPKKCFIVAMETSSERTFAKMGDGPILRAGDKATTFSSPVTAHCQRVAEALAKRSKNFKFQRKLMDGGTCESSAYCTLGYDATGICLALGNYHNVNLRRKTIGPEYIDLDDYDHVVKWFVALGQTKLRFEGHDDVLKKKLEALIGQHRKLLRDTVEEPA